MGGNVNPGATGLYPLDSCGGGQPLRSPGTMRQRRKPWHACVRLMPELRISNLKDLLPIRRAEDFDRWAEGLRKAGLPE